MSAAIENQNADTQNEIHRVVDSFDIELNTEELERIGDPRTPSLLKLRDKFVFCWGVVDVISLAFCLHGFPWVIPWLYIAKAPVLMGVRTYMFFQNKLQYFLLDFCYWANLIVLLYLLILPDNKYLFVVIYSVSHGPLAWSVCLFRNSLVFHSLDKMTSNFIHVSPMLVTYSLRWFTAEQGRYTTCPVDEHCAYFAWTAAVPIAFYTCWIICYGITIRFICPIPDEEYLTSYRWLTRNKGGPLKALREIRYGWLLYGVGNVIVTFLMLCPTILFYHNQLANALFGASICLVSIWNGAGYYIEVFSKRYTSNIEKELSVNSKD